jgi:hypothetical protein
MLLGPKTRRQSIGLRPMGNTITVELASDNPFESGRDVEVYTQVSGGIAGPDPKMRSRGVLTPVMAGYDANFAVSGLGQDAAAAAPAATPAAPTQSFWASDKGTALFNAGLSTATGALNAVVGGMAARQQAKASEIAAAGQARVLSAQASAEQAAAMRAQAEANRLAANKKPFPMIPVLIGAGVLVALIGGILVLKK